MFDDSPIEAQNEQETVQFVHYRLRAGMRFLRLEDDEEAEPDEGSVVAKIKAEFVADYRIRDDHEKFNADDFNQFASTVRFHAYPYIREFLQAAANRMRLPAVAMPMETWKVGAPEP